ncbi:MAG TPA: LysR family transcriptional regulator [Kofleriaceae bacterium]|nr:LysR family transcriptional regulator [Kofleriaceae bacterium]
MPSALDDLVAMGMFARLVEARSFTAAARQLGVSKSVVSTRLSRLEDRLGVRLVNRTTRRLSLTEAGLGFYQHCARIAAEVDEATALMAGAAAEPRGPLRINAPIAFTHLHLIDVLVDFARAYPRIDLVVTTEDRLVDVVEEGYDVVVRVGHLAPSNLIARRIATTGVVVCAAPVYLERHGVPRAPEDLVHHNCLRYSLVSPRDRWRFRRGRRTVSIPVSGDLVSNDSSVLLGAARAGLGIAVLPTFIAASDLRAGRLIPLLDRFRGDDLGVHTLHPHRRHVPPKVRAFVDFLVARFAGRPL